MAVNPNEYFQFVIKPSQNNFTEKPSKDKDNNMSTKSSPSSNEKSTDEKKLTNSQEVVKQTVSEVKVDDIPKNNGDSTKQKKDEKSSHSVQNGLSIEVPSKSVSPQVVTSPSDLKTPPTKSPLSFKNVGKKLGNIIKNSSDQGKASNKIPEQKEAVTATSDSTVQVQQERQTVNNTTPESVPEGSIPEANNNTENTEGTEKIDENQESPETEAAKSRTNSLSKFAHMKLFITRTSSVLVEKSKEVFDELDKRIYPDIDPNLDEENEAKSSNRSVPINEREELLDVSKDNANSSSQKVIQSTQSTQNALADAALALSERQEKLDDIGEKAERLSNSASNFAEIAAQIRKNQEQKNKGWKFW